MDLSLNGSKSAMATDPLINNMNFTGAIGFTSPDLSSTAHLPRLKANLDSQQQIISINQGQDRSDNHISDQGRNHNQMNM